MTFTNWFMSQLSLALQWHGDYNTVNLQVEGLNWAQIYVCEIFSLGRHPSAMCSMS